MRKHSTDTLAAAFWARVRKGPGCWPWTGRKPSFNERVFTGRQKHWGVSRLAWVLTHGPIPDGLWVLHRCDNRGAAGRCCRPSHLYLGTPRDNALDRWARSPVPARPPRTPRRAPDPPRRACSRCGTEKPIEAFPSRSGRRAQFCKECANAAVRARYASDPAYARRRIENAAAYKRASREKRLVHR